MANTHDASALAALDEQSEDTRLGKVPDTAEEEVDDVAELAREVAARRHLHATCEWFAACQQLNLDSSIISLEHLIKATLAEDRKTQVARLDQLFNACGLCGANMQAERSDLVTMIADAAPQNERERHLVYHAEIARRLATDSAALAAAPDNLPQVRVQLSNAFLKLSNYGVTLDEKLKDVRYGSRSGSPELIGHLHVHTVPGLATDGIYIDGGPLAKSLESKTGRRVSAEAALPQRGAGNADAKN